MIGTRWASDDGRVATTVDETARALLLEYERATKAVKALTGVAELEAAGREFPQAMLERLDALAQFMILDSAPMLA